ncbi:D-Ala-D-Ala carboxypeptidase [Steroidobacter agaridevorans]|uniref:serine-type D-Ala-D-Ala carboxypeptidase n=2 Tax=Steroidobacter agaridevorans TaxID=2695856 RepID=A0A829YJR3_9GAMM|nr:D-Ala-D-Ala carboxypeptidase [Steroidobacter agaridevorans]GFE86128.1 D-Ala-D-Ala carboxypeptidase [Steroidobacter agaridevorans]
MNFAMPASKPASLLKFTAASVLALALVACSDSEESAAERTLAAPLPDVAASAAPAGIKPPPIPAPPQVQAKGYILLDYVSGQTLAATNDNERLEPASLTKLMSAYAVFHALKDGRIKMTDMVTISPHARSQDGSRMFVDVGTQVSVENLIQGMIVQSGNDATVALAEFVAGSEPVFVDLMNQYAQQIGMVSTRFQNSPGMPHPEHYTTAHDIALLSRALIKDYPEYYKFYSQRQFTWNKITQPNRNGLLDRDPTVDGLKTGHTESAGYCLVSSARRDGMRLVSVVMGSPSVRAREDASSALLNYGFNFYQTRQLYPNKAPVMTVKVWKGEAGEVPLSVVEDIYTTIPRGQENMLSASADVPDPLFAPLSPGKAAGQLRITLGDKVIGTYPLHPTAEVPEAGFFGRLTDDVKLWMK